MRERAPRSRLRTPERAGASRPVWAARHHRGRGEITVSSGSPSRGGDTGGSGVSGQVGVAERDDVRAGGEPPASVNRLGHHSLARAHRILAWLGAPAAALILIYEFGLWRLMQGSIDLDGLTPFIQ